MKRFQVSFFLLVLLIAAAPAFAQQNILAKVLKRQHASAQRPNPTNPRTTSFERYELFLSSTRLGNATRQIHKNANGLGGFDFDFRADITYTNGNPTAALIFDSATGSVPVARQSATYTATGKIATAESALATGPGTFEVDAYREYFYNAQDSLILYREYSVNGGVPTLSDSYGYTFEFDAQNRIVARIDSSIDSSGINQADSRTTYSYTGNQTVPSQITFFDVDSTGAFEASTRLNNIVWFNYSRFQLTSATLQTPAGPLWLPVGTITGAGTAQQFVQTYAIRTGLGSPPEPFIRITESVNVQGDISLYRVEDYDPQTSTWGVSDESAFDYAYSRPGNNLSFVERSEYDFNLDAVLPVDRYEFSDITTATRNILATTVSLAPNPATSSVSIASTPATQGSILAATGQTVRTFVKDGAGKATVSLSNLPTGIYHVQLGAGASQRLVVE
jgi:hypothetical protein